MDTKPRYIISIGPIYTWILDKDRTIVRGINNLTNEVVYQRHNLTHV